MRITHEADYAIRMLYNLCLAEGQHLGASVLAEQSGVSQRFALKILRKLMQADLVMSFKGANGGYALKRSPDCLSLGEVIELIDGPIVINHCLEDAYPCTRVLEKEACCFHHLFRKLNAKFRNELYRTTFDQFLQH